MVDGGHIVHIAILNQEDAVAGSTEPVSVAAIVSNGADRLTAEQKIGQTRAVITVDFVA